MRVKTTLLFFLALLGIFSCRKDKFELLFELPLSSLEFNIEAGSSTLDTYYFFFDNVPTHFEELAGTYGFEAADVKAILPGKAFIRSIFGESYEDLFWEIAVQVCPEGDREFKCGKEAFYWKFPTQTLGSDFDLVPNEPDLKEWLTEDKVNIQLWFRLAKTPSQSISSRLDLRFNAVK